MSNESSERICPTHCRHAFQWMRNGRCVGPDGEHGELECGHRCPTTADAQREPELITAEKGTSLREFIDKYGPATSQGTNWYKDLGDVLLEARSRPTVEPITSDELNQLSGALMVEQLARYGSGKIIESELALVFDNLLARLRAAGRPTVEAAEIADKLRMDWLEDAVSGGHVESAFEMDGGIYLTVCEAGDLPIEIREKNTLREAIDAAMNRGQKHDI